MHSVDSSESRENKKKSSSKMLPQWDLNPVPLTFMSCMLLSELNPLFAGGLSPLDPCITMLY